MKIGNPSGTDTVNIKAGIGKTLHVEEVKKKSFGVFQAIGPINCIYTKEQPINTDIFDVLGHVSKAAYSLFNELKNNRNPHNNIVHYPLNQLSKNQQIVIRRRIKELRDRNIICKARTIDTRRPILKNSYMINPNLIMCTADHQEDAKETWTYLS